ncbi:MAG: hypothetical protein ABIR91_06080 [Candidatus Saccharimonadales bacterium]
MDKPSDAFDRHQAETRDMGVSEGYFEPYNPETTIEPGAMHYARPQAISYIDTVNDGTRKVARDKLIDLIVEDTFSGRPAIWSDNCKRVAALAYIDYRALGHYSAFVTHTEILTGDGATSTYSVAWISPSELQQIDEFIDSSFRSALDNNR